jgi:hypothetical protein
MNNTELAKRAGACKHWRWMPGMAYWRQCNRYRTEDDTRVTYDEACLLDISDAATLGCLIHLVREAWGDHCLHVRPEGGQWRVWGIEPGAHVYLTEAEALVAALEAAP